MMLEAVISNADHPEYGVATIPFPIPKEQYDQCIEMVKALEIGDPFKKDCKVVAIDSAFSVLKITENLRVNLDELDYLAKRLESFDVGEAAQFQAMASKLELFELQDLINLTFCCQQATVITDFSDLEQIGRDHYMNLHGGGASVQELEDLDGVETAILLIDAGGGTITRYGVVYDNGMKLEQSYDGKHFPAYLYEPCIYDGFISMVNKLRFSEDNILAQVISRLEMTLTAMKRNNIAARDLSKSITELNAKLLMLEQLRSKGYLAIEVYQAQANEINAELAKLKDVRQEKFNSKAATMLEEVKKLKMLIFELEEPLETFDAKLFMEIVKSIQINKEDEMSVELLGGLRFKERI